MKSVGKPLDRWIESIQAVPIETNDSTLLHHISIGGVTDEDIVMYNHDAVYFVNNESGKIDLRLNKLGRGPGEYNMVFQVVVNEQDSTFFVFDPAYKNLNIYNFDGNFVRAIHNDSLGGVTMMDDGNYVVSFAPNIHTDYRIGIYDKDWNLKRISIPRMKRPEFDMYYYDMVGHYDGGVFFRGALIDTLYSVTSLSEEPLVIIKKGIYKMPVEIAADRRKTMQEKDKYIWQEYGRFMGDFFYVFYV